MLVVVHISSRFVVAITAWTWSRSLSSCSSRSQQWSERSRILSKHCGRRTTQTTGYWLYWRDEKSSCETKRSSCERRGFCSCSGRQASLRSNRLRLLLSNVAASCRLPPGAVVPVVSAPPILGWFAQADELAGLLQVLLERRRGPPWAQQVNTPSASPKWLGRLQCIGCGACGFGTQAYRMPPLVSHGLAYRLV